MRRSAGPDGRVSRGSSAPAGEVAEQGGVHAHEQGLRATTPEGLGLRGSLGDGAAATQLQRGRLLRARYDGRAGLGKDRGGASRDEQAKGEELCDHCVRTAGFFQLRLTKVGDLCLGGGNAERLLAKGRPKGITPPSVGTCPQTPVTLENSSTGGISGSLDKTISHLQVGY